METGGPSRPGSSPLHRGDPRAKLLALIGILVAVGWAMTWRSLVAAGVVVTGALVLGRYPGRRLAAMALPLGSLAALTIVLNAALVKGDPIASVGPVKLTRLGLGIGLVYAAKLALAVLATNLFLFTTSPLDLADALAEARWLPAPARAGWRRLALFLSLAVRFLPTVREEIARIRDGQRARGVTLRGGPMTRLRDLVALVVPVVLWVVVRARQAGDALDARGFDASRRRSSLSERRFAARDALLLAVPAALLVAVRRLA
jgi:energy-coupling factor transport system permease protein